MTFDPICNQYFTTVTCCATDIKVVVINYYNIAKEYVQTLYFYPNGSKAEDAPAGLDCGCGVPN